MFFKTQILTIRVILSSHYLDHNTYIKAVFSTTKYLLYNANAVVRA